MQPFSPNPPQLSCAFIRELSFYRLCTLQPTPCSLLRRRNARVRGRRWRKEQRRIREAEAKQERREREFREKLRTEIAMKVETLAKQEALLEQR